MRFKHIIYLIGIALFTLNSCSYKASQVLFEQNTKTVKPVTPATTVKPAKSSKSTKTAKNTKTASNLKPGKNSATAKNVTPEIISKSDTVAVTDTAAAKIVNYRIQPQDILQIRNLQNSKTIVDLTPVTSTSSTNNAATPQPETFRVEDDGTIALTGLGRIKVAGLTRIEATKYIEERYKETLLTTPLIEVTIINMKVTVFGEVKSPGNFPLTKDRTSLVEILGTAGGLTEKADEKDIRIIRGEAGHQTEIKINLSKRSAANDPKATLQNNDLIVVGQNEKTIRADNVQVFSTVIQPILIVLSALIVITSLIKK